MAEIARQGSAVPLGKCMVVTNTILSLFTEAKRLSTQQIIQEFEYELSQTLTAFRYKPWSSCRRVESLGGF